MRLCKKPCAQPQNELGKELIAGLRQAHTKRHPRAAGLIASKSQTWQYPPAPPEAQERLLPGHWGGDLLPINRSAVGILMAPVSGLEFLAKMDGATPTAAVQGFSATLNRVPPEMRQTFTYDQCRKLVRLVL